MTDQEVINSWKEYTQDKIQTELSGIFSMVHNKVLTFEECLKEMKNKTEIGVELIAIWRLGISNRKVKNEKDNSRID